MDQSPSVLKKRRVGAHDQVEKDAQNASDSAQNSLKTSNAGKGNGFLAEDAQDSTVWGKTEDSKPFKVPTTHDVMTLFHPSYPKSHFDMLSLFLLGSQLVIFWFFLSSARNHPQPDGPQTFAKRFFLCYFFFWRAMYDAGLGWVLTKQSKKKWIVNLVKRKGWFDKDRRPKTRAWLKRQLEGKMGKDYNYDSLPLEYNTWLLFRQVVDIILLNDFLSYVLFALSNLDFLFSRATPHSPVDSPRMITVRIFGGLALLLFNLWVKTSAHDIVKDYGWYWGDCFFSRGYLRKSTKGHDTQRESGETDEEAGDLHFDLVFDGIFEMAPHPMYSVGYAGYYGVSLLAASYPVLFVSLAAHAAQFAFLNFFENPHIERRYGVRKVLAERTPIVPISRSRSNNTMVPDNNDNDSTHVGRSRSVSLETNSEEKTAFESEYGHDAYDTVRNAQLGLTPETAIVASITPPNGVSEVMQEAVTQHDLLNKFFHKDVIVFSGIDLLRSQDQLLVLLTVYILLLAVLPTLQPSQQTVLYLHFAHALAWRIYYSFILGLILKGQSDSRFLVRHFLEHYHYSPLSLADSPRARGDRGVKEGAIRDAFDNWKGMYNLGMVMCYASFFGFAYQTYQLPAVWAVGDQLLRHTMGVLLVALHLWAAKESYEVLGIFGWFFGDFFIDDYPTSLNYTGIYRFLNNPERTMSGAGLFGLALITGSKGVFVLALLSYLAHWWFMNWVEEPHMKKLYGDSLRKDAGFTKMLKKLAKQNAEIFGGVRKQLTVLLEESSLASKHAPELMKVAQGVREVGERIGEVYNEGTERVEDAWKRSSDLADYDQTKYSMHVVPTNPDGQLRFHWGEPITVIWRSPMKHSRRDWVGLYRYGANKSQLITKTSSLGLWVPVHDEEWDGDVPKPLTDRDAGEETECGELTFKNSTLPWQIGDYELRYHHDGKYNVVALIGPIQVYMDRPDALDFKSIRQWLLKIVMLALDSDSSLIPKSSIETISHAAIQNRLPVLLSKELNGSSTSVSTVTPSTTSCGTSVGSPSGTPSHSHDIHDDDFRFWSERQARRISWAISQVLSIDFAPEVIVADANVTALTRRILASKELLGP
ncbi:phosphatidylethanolamine N-methyltransferase [Serendipita sp. 399]|nr:phosphatidylethanolamine N-methyltransferase [Serendipita sp. 399]